jgi:bacteriorhodopsin
MSNGETVMLSVKAIMFLALELFVFAIFGAILVAGLHEIVEDKIEKARHADQIAAEGSPAAPARRTA